MPNCIVSVVSFCCVVTRRTFPPPKMPSIEPWKSLEANRPRLSSCAAHLDLRAFTSQMAERWPYPRCSPQSSSISIWGKISLKSKKRRSCSSIVIRQALDGRLVRTATESLVTCFQSQRCVGPYRRAEDLSRYEEGLRQAGLPD